MNDWHPMATAPKDGTFVLTWDSEGGHGLLRHNEIFAMAGEDADGWMGATHWMPLPEPPTPTEEKQS
jgi:hypothetical protein